LEPLERIGTTGTRKEVFSATGRGAGVAGTVGAGVEAAIDAADVPLFCAALFVVPAAEISPRRYFSSKARLASDSSGESGIPEPFPIAVKGAGGNAQSRILSLLSLFIRAICATPRM
jgi:hypothetical protein